MTGTNFFSLCLLVVTGLFILHSCNNKQASQSFATKTEALHFADSIYASYPGVTRASVATFTRKDTLTPIDWDVVIQYSRNYDDSPLLKKPDMTPYKGFLIDSAGYALLVRKHNKYKQVYLRFGRRSNGEYTIMVLPMAADSIIHRGRRNPNKATDNNNYDHLDPCPEQCPTNFDTPQPLRE